MKKGCFLTLIIGTTIVLGMVLYLYQQHKDDAIKYIADYAAGKMSEDIDDHASGKGADSLKSLIKQLPDNLKNKRLSIEQVGNITDMVGNIYNDGFVDSLELSRLTDTLKKKLADYERSKKNKH